MSAVIIRSLRRPEPSDPESVTRGHLLSGSRPAAGHSNSHRERGAYQASANDYHLPYVFGRTARYRTQKFFESALSSQDEGCIVWPFYKDRCGYAQMNYGGKARPVSRIVCEVAHGHPISDDLQAAHSCGNPGCINPRHISWKTPVENCEDKIAHGTNQLGETNSCAKLTDDQVREIRALEGVTQREIAARYQIAQGTVWDILHHRKWRHVV